MWNHSNQEAKSKGWHSIQRGWCEVHADKLKEYVRAKIHILILYVFWNYMPFR